MAGRASGLVPLLLLGSFHMDNPGRDMHNPESDNMLSDLRQREIAAVVEGLRGFRATRVALELLSWKERNWNQDVSAFGAGAFALSADERHQLGFRVAAASGLTGVDAIDWFPPEDGSDVDLGMVYSAAQTHQPQLFEEITGQGDRFVAEFQARQRASTVGDLLRWLNDDTRLSEDHRNYLSMARVVAPDRFVGAEWVSGWFERNLRIFVNLTRLLSGPDDRILVVYGVGHIPLLRQFARDSGLFEVESLNTYLP